MRELGPFRNKTNIVHRAWALSIFTSVHNEADNTLDERDPSLFIVSLVSIHPIQHICQLTVFNE